MRTRRSCCLHSQEKRIRTTAGYSSFPTTPVQGARPDGVLRLTRQAKTIVRRLAHPIVIITRQLKRKLARTPFCGPLFLSLYPHFRDPQRHMRRDRRRCIIPANFKEISCLTTALTQFYGRSRDTGAEGKKAVNTSREYIELASSMLRPGGRLAPEGPQAWTGPMRCRNCTVAAAKTRTGTCICSKDWRSNKKHEKTS